MFDHKTVKHYYEPGHLHELTFSCQGRMPLLTNDDWREKLSRAIDAANQEVEVELVAFVFMPEHIHLLVHPKSHQSSISKYLARIKQLYSKCIKRALEENQSPLLARLTVQERPGKRCFRFWQEGPGSGKHTGGASATLQAAVQLLHFPNRS